MFLKRRASAPLVAGMLALTLALAGCGDDATESTTTTGPDTPTSSVPGNPPDPGVDGGDKSGVPDLPPDNEDPTAVVCVGAGGPETLLDATTFKGETIASATNEAGAAGCSIRVVEEDGESLAVTDDYSPTRINVAVADGKVSRIVGMF